MISDWEQLTCDIAPAMPNFVKALSVLAFNAKDDYHDYLGIVYMELGAANKWNGQYFTPFEVARMMAELILGDVRDWPEDKPLRICDPTAGSGALLLAAAHVIAMSNPKLLERGQVYFFGADIDYTCVQMAKLNLILHGLDSLSQRGFCKEPSTAKLYSELTREEKIQMEVSFGKSVEELAEEAQQMRQLQLPGMGD